MKVRSIQPRKVVSKLPTRIAMPAVMATAQTNPAMANRCRPVGWRSWLKASRAGAERTPEEASRRMKNGGSNPAKSPAPSSQVRADP